MPLALPPEAAGAMAPRQVLPAWGPSANTVLRQSLPSSTVPVCPLGAGRVISPQSPALSGLTHADLWPCFSRGPLRGWAWVSVWRRAQSLRRSGSRVSSDREVVITPQGGAAAAPLSFCSSQQLLPAVTQRPGLPPSGGPASPSPQLSTGSLPPARRLGNAREPGSPREAGWAQLAWAWPGVRG